MSKRRLTPEQRQKMIDLYCTGSLITALSVQFGVHETTINRMIPNALKRGQKFRSKRARKPTRQHLPKYKRQLVIYSYCIGFTIDALAEHFQRDRTRINAMIPKAARRGHAFRAKGTRPFNAMRAYNKEQRADRRIGRQRQTHCKRGHELTPDNTRVHHNGRECRKCVNDNAKIRYNADPALRERVAVTNKRIREARKQQRLICTPSSTGHETTSSS